ncbi:unnamed protein product [Lasius platythorax]|uniref:Transmembrane protein n=1 Tax=Lasius platythorax TaxID=488582 RepID=A0AAV2NEL4_9HYME
MCRFESFKSTPERRRGRTAVDAAISKTCLERVAGGFIVVAVIVLTCRSYARLGWMFCLNEGRVEPRERSEEPWNEEDRATRRARYWDPLFYGGSRRHRDEEPLCEGPSALVVPRLPASRLRSIKRVLIDPSIDAWMANVAPTNFSYCRALTSDLPCISAR